MTFRFTLIAFLIACHAGAVGAQPVELKPVDVPKLGYGPSAERAKEHVRLREEYRRTYWAREAERIERFGQTKNVVRDDDNLYIYVDPTAPARDGTVFTTIWGVDPAAQYFYLAYDEAAQFHIVGAGGTDLPFLYLISARTGLAYQAFGAGEPVFSPDKRRFLSLGFQGMGCTAGVAIYRFDDNKPFQEMRYDLGCDAPCTQEWLSATEARVQCRSGSGGTTSEHRLTLSDGAWRSTRTSQDR